MIDPVVTAKVSVCKQVVKMTNIEPVGLYDYLSIITGPDCLPLLEDLIQKIKDKES